MVGPCIATRCGNRAGSFSHAGQPWNVANLRTTTRCAVKTAEQDRNQWRKWHPCLFGIAVEALLLGATTLPGGAWIVVQLVNFARIIHYPAFVLLADSELGIVWFAGYVTLLMSLWAFLYLLVTKLAH